MTDTIVLTGISGFIAKRIAADLLDAGYHVRGTLRSASRADEVRAAVKPALKDASGLDERLTFAEADLTSDAGWADAMAGAAALFHTASPFPIAQPKDAEELIRPAVDGTLRALRAARAAGVHRVVLTSSIAAVMYNERRAGHVYTEADWTDVDHPTANPYTRSKTLAERAAWDFVAEFPEMQLTTVNPGLVAGRPMDRNYGSSLGVIERFLSGKDPFVPDFGLPIVDVADVSALHLAALRRPETAGSRVIASEGFVMAPQMTQWLAAAYPGNKIATRKAPKFLLWLLSFVDPEIRSILPAIGENKIVSNAWAREQFGVTFIPSRDAVLASAAFLSEGKAQG